MLQLKLLPARQGDALWIRWGERALTHQMLVDMGTIEIGRSLRERLVDAGDFELLVVTHIDADHIGGVVSCLVDKPEPIEGARFAEIWFNGPRVEPLDPELEPMGAKQAIALSAWLTQHAWNARFQDDPVMLDGAPRSFTLAGALKVTVLGPPRQRVDRLGKVWTPQLLAELRERVLHYEKEEEEEEDVEEMNQDEIESMGEDLEAMGKQKPRKPRLKTAKDVAALAARVTGDDDTIPNGSSISLLLEHGDHAVLLAGDAYPGDLVAGIEALGREGPLRLDAFKLPHHGSRRNMTRALMEAVDCPRFLFSTDGTQFYHPDADAVACVIQHGARGRIPQLGFNCRSRYSAWWDNAAWKRDFGYSTEYGGEDGLTIDLT